MRFVALLLILASCGPRPGVLANAPAVDIADAREALVVPPDADARRALREVTIVAKAGDPRAAWLRLHYLVDLFDVARYEPDPELRGQSRKFLFEAIGLAEGEGAGVTNQVIDELVREADEVLKLDRLHAGAQAAKTLLEFERLRPERQDLFARMAAIKAVARGDGPLAANAQLRLADFCRVAFRDAGRAATPFRPGLLVYCLYPLYDSDPEPYFAADVRRRPPQPAWTDLAEGVKNLLAGVSASKSRIASLGGALAQDDQAFLAKTKQLMPSAPAPADLAAPMLARAEPYEWTPLVRLGDGSQPPAADLDEKLKPILAADKRGRVAISLASGAPALMALLGARSARLAGADLLELVVGYEQVVKAPKGDYWFGKAPGDKLARLGVVPVALDLSGGRRQLRPFDWDPGRATLGLHLLIGSARWRLVSPQGAFPDIPATDPAAAASGLRAQLAEIRAGFPDEDGLVLVPEAGATYGQLVNAAQAARSDAGGRPLFTALALAERTPTVNARLDLPARTARRAAASVSVVPDALAGRAPALRQCYQDALDRNPKLAGVVTVELRQPVKSLEPTATVTAGPNDKPLRACLAQGLNAAMTAGQVKSVRVTLSLAK